MPPTAEQLSAGLAEREPPYRAAPEVEEVAEQLMARYPGQFGFIAANGFRLVYLLRTDGMPTDSKIDTLAKCIRAPALWSYLAACEFVVWVNGWWWTAFPQHREAILLHELLHISATEQGQPALAPHDVEEFIGVAGVYGAWETARRRFAEAMVLHDSREASGAEMVEELLRQVDGALNPVEKSGDNSLAAGTPEGVELAEQMRAMGVTGGHRDPQTGNVTIEVDVDKARPRRRKETP